MTQHLMRMLHVSRVCATYQQYCTNWTCRPHTLSCSDASAAAALGLLRSDKKLLSYPTQQHVLHFKQSLCYSVEHLRSLTMSSTASPSSSMTGNFSNVDAWDLDGTPESGPSHQPWRTYWPPRQSVDSMTAKELAEQPWLT